MRRIATIRDRSGQAIGIVDGPDAWGQSVTVRDRKWFFDFDEWMGPLWLKADGTTEWKCQNPNPAVWRAFERWHSGYKRSKATSTHPKATT